MPQVTADFDSRREILALRLGFDTYISKRGRKEGFFCRGFANSKFQFTLGNCGLSRATVARAARAAAFGLPAAGAGRHVTRETRSARRSTKTVVELKKFILLSEKAAARYNFQLQKRSRNLSRCM